MIRVNSIAGLIIFAVTLAPIATAQQSAPKSQPAQPSAPTQITSGSSSPQAGITGLQKVLSQMDSSAAGFRSAQADLTSVQYQKVVDETDTQKGKAYFRRAGKNNLEMALDITQPDAKYVLLKDDKVRLYQPAIDQVTEYNIAKNRADVESMFALGFGGRGHDLLKAFEAKLAGDELVQGIHTAKLELWPRSDKVKNMFSLITLWVDPERGISLQQRFDEPSGDYRVAQYSNIRLNQKISDDVFKLKTTAATKVVTPQS